MHRLKLCSTLGFTPQTRKRRMRDNIQANAETLHKMGLDSRIPFLKATLGADWKKIPDGSTARREDGIPVPEWKEGDVLRVISPQLAMRFNIFNAARGIQAVYDFATEVTRVVPCSVEWIGDLRLVRQRKDAPAEIKGRAHYHIDRYMVLLLTDRTDTAAAHEIEHARHYSISLLSGFGFYAPGGVDAEYLALTTQLLACRDAVACDAALGGWQNALRSGVDLSGQVPHLLASFRFLARLMVLNGMKEAEIRDAINASYTSEDSSVSPAMPKNPNLSRMVEFGKKEYQRTYERLFGLPFDDICDIITGLPMI